MRDFAVAAHIGGPLTAALDDADVLVIAHPSEPEWERTVPGGSPRFDARRARRDRGVGRAPAAAS